MAAATGQGAQRRTVFDRVINVIVLVVLIGAGLGTSFTSFAVNIDALATWWSGFWQNFSTEMYGAFLTFLLIEVLVGGRQARQARREEHQREKASRDLQERLMSELHEQLRGYIQGQEIARLRAAATQKERQPILDGMRATGLLREASLNWTNLQGARLMSADLHGTGLLGANLQAANLDEANLQDARLESLILGNAEFDEETRLPDRTRWSTDTDLARFTDPAHPKFWRSDNWRSPAYRGANDPDDPGYARHKIFWPDD